MDLKILFTLFVLIHACFCKHEEFIGSTVHGVVLRNLDDIKLIRELESDLDLDIWRAGLPGVKDAYIMVRPQYMEKFLARLDEAGIQHYVHNNDVVRALDDFEARFNQWKLRRNNDAIYNTYPRYGEIEAYLDRLGREYPNIVTVVNAGNSYEGRPMKYVKISTTNFEDPTKPIYFMDAAMHSREWVTPPVALYTIHRLVEDLRTEDRDLLENIDWVIMPVFNPDGWEFSHVENRMWRRSRSFNASISPICYGADLNRNFDIFFGTFSVSSNPCSDIYPGPFAFSEVESRNVRDMLYLYLDRIQIYMNMHSYGNFILYGFDNNTLPHNVAQLHYVAAAMGAHIDARKMADAPYYAVGNSNYVLYGASGTSQDYAQAIGVPFAITLELPEFDGYNFLVPPEYIEQINTETYAGIAETARLSYLFYRDRL